MQPQLVLPRPRDLPDDEYEQLSRRLPTGSQVVGQSTMPSAAKACPPHR